METPVDPPPLGARWALLRFKRFAVLDHRTHDLTTGPVPPVTEAQLVEALRTLIAAPPREAEGRCCLRDALRGGLQGDPERELSLDQTAVLRLADALLHASEVALRLHPSAAQPLRPLQIVLARLLYEEPAAIFDPQHPACILIELMLRIARCHDDGAGQRGQGLLAEIGRILRDLAGGELASGESFQAAQADLVGVLNSHHQLVSRLEQRLIEKERGERRLEDLRGFVRATIARALAGKRVPAFVIQFLGEVWEKYLYVHLLRQGIEHSAWHQGVLDMSQLIWSVTTGNGPKLRQRLPTDLADSLERIRQGAEAIHHSFAIAPFFEQLLAFHRRTIEGEKHPRSLYLSDKKEPEPPASKADRPPVPPEVMLLRPGCWYRLSLRGREVRAKLIDRNLDYRYLLFANLSGISVARLDFDAFMEQLRIGYVEPIDTGPVWEQLLRLALDEVEGYANLLETEVAAREQARIQEREEQRRAELRRRMEEEERRLMLERSEARRRAEETARREREAAQAEALAEAERLQPGGMVELTGEGGDIQVCALGLKLKSSHKLVFVDRNGRRVAELSVEQLADRLLEGSAAIVGYQGQTDRNLETLIWDMRSTSSQRLSAS